MVAASAARRYTIFIVTAFAVACYYIWALQASGNRFQFRGQQQGYYNYLAQGFASGHLYLPATPSPQLLALANPWDPVANEPHRLHDAVLFNGRYYLYHGAAPAVLLFAPWRILTGSDVSENFGVFIFAVGGFLFLSGALIRVLDHAGGFTLALLMLVLGVCNGVPYLTNRVLMYEVAISAGYFCVAGGIFFLAWGVTSTHPQKWLAASGLFFGIAISCRPHLFLAGAIAFALLIVRYRRSVVAFLVPFLVVVGAIGWYNYARFGSPAEFGLSYLLTGDTHQQRLTLSVANVAPGLYYMLFSPPEVSQVFPFFRMALRFPWNAREYPFPEGYFLEPTVGALCLAPVLAGVVMLPWIRQPARIIGSIAAVSGLAIMLFLSATGFASQRYEIDFVPLIVFAGVVTWGASSRMWLVGLVPLFIYSLVLNLALGITGPYDDVLRTRPRSYIRIAGWFSPRPETRPMLDPAIDVDAEFRFKPQAAGIREPLVFTGQQVYRHMLFAEHLGTKLRIVSQADDSIQSADIDWQESVRVHVSYRPGLIMMQVGAVEMRHEVQHIVTAPAQVRIGENLVAPNFTARRFSGHVVEQPLRVQ